MRGGKAHKVRFPPALLLCPLLAFFYGTYKERSARCSMFLRVLKALMSIYFAQGKNVVMPTTP